MSDNTSPTCEWEMWNRQLESTLIALALPADTQAALLDGSNLPVDELALAFDDAYRGWLLQSRSRVPDAEIQLVGEINDMLDQMSGPENAALWTREALSSDVRWQEVRHVAGQIVVKRLIDQRRK